jgi:hypothetical protein
VFLTEAGTQDPDDVYFGAFSAGGSLLKRLLENPAYRKMVTGVFLADATYTSSWENAQQRIPPVIQGFADYAVDVVNSGGSKIFVATASINPNKTWATGIENLDRIMVDVEEQTGRSFERIPHFFGVTNPAGIVPEYVYKLGNVIFAEFSGNSDFGHGQTKIQDQVWQKILHPWLAQGKGTISDSEQLSVSGGLGNFLVFAVAAGFGFAAMTKFAK